MDPIYLGGPKPPSEPEPMDQDQDQEDFTDEDDEEDQLLSDLEDTTAAPPSPSPPALPPPSGHDIEPDPIDDDEPPSTSASKRGKGSRKAGFHRAPGYSHLPEERVDHILEENGAAGPMSKEATFLLSIATEEFVRRFTQAGHMIAESESRDVIEYGDLAQSTSMRCFSMLEDVVPCSKPLATALELRAQFIKRQVAEDPALTAAAPDPRDVPRPPPLPVTVWEHTPTPIPDAPPPPAAHSSSSAPPPTNASKRSRSTPSGATTNGKRKAKDKDKDKDGGGVGDIGEDGTLDAGGAPTAATNAKERRASMRQRDKHGRFGNNPIDPRVWDNKFAPAPAAAPPQDPWANQPPAPAVPVPVAAGVPGANETPFAATGRTIYSQR